MPSTIAMIAVIVLMIIFFLFLIIFQLSDMVLHIFQNLPIRRYRIGKKTDHERNKSEDNERAGKNQRLHVTGPAI
jgi:hypothetical protein